MSHYGVLHPTFWGGPTGKAIAKEGGKDAQLLALYLTANQDATMIGLYPIDLVIVRARIQTLTSRAITSALDALARAEFADFDLPTGYVWVREMAKFRLSLNVRPLDVKDNRIKGVQRLYRDCKPNPFLGPFYDRYHAELYLGERRSDEPAPPSKPLVRASEAPLRGLEAPSKPVTEAVTGSVAEAGTGQANQDQDPAASRRPLRIDFKTLAEAEGQVRAAIHAHLDAYPDAGDGDLVNAAKDAAAGCHAVDYKGHEITALVNAVRGTRARRSA